MIKFFFARINDHAIMKKKRGCGLYEEQIEKYYVYCFLGSFDWWLFLV